MANTKALNEQFISVEEETLPEWTWVNIPERDLLDQPFSGIGHNLAHFGPSSGNLICNCRNYPACAKTGDHKIPTEIAKEVQERLRIAQVADLKVFSGRKDMKALMALVSKGLQASSGVFKDPTEPGV